MKGQKRVEIDARRSGRSGSQLKQALPLLHRSHILHLYALIVSGRVAEVVYRERSSIEDEEETQAEPILVKRERNGGVTDAIAGVVQLQAQGVNVCF